MPISLKIRNIIISIFTVAFIFLFHYESLRHFYLNPLVGKELPKTKFLFPPAGWIMFFNVDDDYGFIEVYGVKNNIPEKIDPHAIFRTRTIGFDNIHRNVLSTVASVDQAPAFCKFLRYRFPYYDKFLVVGIDYPELTKDPYKKYESVQYQCLTK